MPNSSKNFKVLAIRPLSDCQQRYRNNLKENQLYQFYGSYKFTETNKKITSIEKIGQDYGLFNEFVPKGRNLKLNVAAILGKNGSGKSTLTELLFLSCYLIAVNNGLLLIDEKKNRKEKQEYVKILSGLKLEVYYEVEDAYYCIVVDDKFKPTSKKSTNIQFIDLLKTSQTSPVKHFFYSIAVNYSIYGLNEAISGAWVGRLFHKNDGYQTPVVINPFRDQGNISVTGEMHFAQTRLLSNIMFSQGNNYEIIPGKRVRTLEFIINRQKIRRLEGHAIERVIEELEISSKKSAHQIFELAYEELLDQKFDGQSVENEDWRQLTENYVIGKLVRIAMKYPEYKKFSKRYSEEEVPGLQNLSRYIKALKKDRTHITLKLRQALNFYKNDPLRKGDSDIIINKERVRIPIDIFAERLKGLIRQNPKDDPMEFIPVAPFTPRFVLNDGIEFARLSSGEQQYIHSLQAVIYHILNLNSVFNSEGEVPKVTYDCINIVLDEIELYFHPEFQRRFIKDLLKTVCELSIPHIAGINILFLTHSPFILSDIPAINVLRLADGNVIKDQTLTFAGNIHQMLATSFFMDSTTGDFSRFLYGLIIDFYDLIRTADDGQLVELRKVYLEKRAKFVYVIDQIGEVVIRGVLKNHLSYLDEKLEFDADNNPNKRDQLETQIAYLTQQLKDLNDKNSLS